jgi:hypothetical protein
VLTTSEDAAASEETELFAKVFADALSTKDAKRSIDKHGAQRRLPAKAVAFLNSLSKDDLVALERFKISIGSLEPGYVNAVASFI